MALGLSGCGGNVIFDTAASGAGGASTSATVGVTTGVTGPTSGHTGVTVTTAGTTHAATTNVGTTNAAVTTASVTTGSGQSCDNVGFSGINGTCGQEGLACSVPYSCCGMQAVCTNGRWRATGPTCQQLCLTCGDAPFGCQGNAICVVDELSSGPTYQCAKDPCPPGALDCACAHPVCEQNFLNCGYASQSTVKCYLGV